MHNLVIKWSISRQSNCWWTFCKKRFSHCEQKESIFFPSNFGPSSWSIGISLFSQFEFVVFLSICIWWILCSPYFLWTPSVSFVDKGAFISPKFLLCKLPPHFSTRAGEENHLCKIILQFCKLSLEFIFLILFCNFVSYLWNSSVEYFVAIFVKNYLCTLIYVNDFFVISILPFF